MPKRYLLLVQHGYAFEILRPLQRAIRERGDEAAWFLIDVDPSLLDAGEKLLATVAEVVAYNPFATYLPGNWVPRFFPGIKVQIFHGLANDATGKKGHYRIRGLFDLYCTHAPEGTKIFSKLAQRHGHFAVIETGWPKLDPLFGDQIQAYPTPGDRPVVLYASTFSPSLTSAPTLLDTIASLSQSGQWQWLITLHPKMDADLVARYRSLQGPNLTFVDCEEGILPLLKSADVMLCDTSSIALEFLLQDKPLVTYRTKVPGPHLLDVRESDQVEDALKRALRRPEAQIQAARAYMQGLHAYRDGKSSQRVLEATDRFANEMADSLKPKPLNPWRRLQIRWRMGYWRR